MSKLTTSILRCTRDPISSVFRWLWRKTLPEQGVFESGTRIVFGRWSIRYHNFGELDCGFVGRGENLRPESELVDGWELLYSKEVVLPMGSIPHGNFVRLPGFPDRYAGVWIATNPKRNRIAVVGVRHGGNPIYALREVAYHLSVRGKKKARYAVVGNLLTWLEDRPAADRLCVYVAERTIPDYPELRNPDRWRKRQPGPALGSGRAKLVNGKLIREAR